MDAGCGTGRYSVALALHGFRVIAVDRSPELLQIAEERVTRSGAEVGFECGDFTHGWRPSGLVDGILCRGVLNDLIDEDERRRAFNSFASWLRPGGALLVDVRDREASLRRYRRGRRFVRTVHREEDTLTFTSTTRMAPDSDLLDVREHWAGTADGAPVEETDRFTMRCWTRESLVEAARAGGFGAVSAFAGGAIGARDDRLVAVAVR